MKDTITEQLLQAHLVSGALRTGGEIGLLIDQTLTQDATGTLVYLAFESLGLPAVKVPLAVSYVDHNIIQTDSRNADDHRYLQSCAARFGVFFSGPGNGVSHHVHRQRFGVPGATLLGSDSHTTTGGCLGMLAMGSGGIEVAMAMAGKPYFIATPAVWGIHVEGKLQPFVSGKDVILELLRRYSCRAGVGKVMEFFGSGVAGLDMSARATIANMAVDMGFSAAVFPSDTETRDYLARNGREAAWRELKCGRNPQWDEVTRLDLGTIEPLVACPGNPDNVRPVAELGSIDIHQVIIGSSCNGSFRDFMIAAEIVKAKMKHPQVDFEINPGSRQTQVNVLAAGGIQSLIEAGARVHEAGCLGCIGMGQAPATGTVSLRTFPRNFSGRSGTRNDQVYLCSPETAAASALSGRITDPRTLGPCPSVKYPERYSFNNGWFIAPSPSARQTEILRGPNIKPLPQFGALPDTLAGEVLLKLGDNISTDVILPAGNRVLPLRSNIPAISEFVFESVEPGFARRARIAPAGIVVGGENYGQGSSREHAALAPRYLGVVAKIAKSFARIHRANLVNFGIVPLTFVDMADYDRVLKGETLTLPAIRQALERGECEIEVRAGSGTFRARLDLSSRQRRILLAGGILNDVRS